MYALAPPEHSLAGRRRGVAEKGGRICRRAGWRKKGGARALRRPPANPSHIFAPSTPPRHGMDGHGSKLDYAGQKRFKVYSGWTPGYTTCIPRLDAPGMRGLPQSAVVPIRQFCRVKPPDAAARAASFTRLDVSGFADMSGGRGCESGTCTSVEGRAVWRRLPRIAAARIPPPSRHGKLDARAREFCLQEALDDETVALLGRAYDSNNGIKGDMWVDGATGDDARGSFAAAGVGGAGLALAGLLAAREKIIDRDPDADHLICYTAAGAIAGLRRDPEFEKEHGRFLGGTAAGSAATIANMLVAAAPPQTALAGGAETGRSVMFVRNASLGLISDDTVTVTAERDGEGGLYLAARHLIGGVVLDAGSMCGILHA